MQNELKRTALCAIHEALGAKMVPFAGYLMPVQYEGVNAEHETVRQGVGVFDVSHMGEFMVKGPQALDLIQQVVTNDVSTLVPGKAMYAALTNPQGGVIDDLIVYMLAEHHYMLVVNASNIDKDFQWITSQNAFDAVVENHSDHFALLAVQGPKAAEALQSLTAVNLADIPYYHFVQAPLAGIDGMIISATGYTGAGGFELYCPVHQAETLWNKVFEAGAAVGIKPIGLAARDTLRLEMGYCLYGNDLSDTTSPLEAGLGWITKLNKKFVGSDVLTAQKAAGVTRKLIGFELTERGIPRHDYVLCNEAGDEIGIVTSGTMSPSMGKGIGLGYVQTAYSAVGTNIYIQIRNNRVAAQVVKLPFYKKA